MGPTAAVSLAHQSSGDPGAPALVLSNSLGTRLEMWDGPADVLAQCRWLIRYDHRGHGASPEPPGPYALSDIANDALALLDSLGIERTSFCGISLGGMVGLWLAANAPERIERLVVCCSSAHMPPASAWAERAAAVREAGSVGAVAGAVVSRWLTPGFAARRPEVLAGLREMLAGAPPAGYAACCEAIGAMDLRPMLARISAPTLVISAAQDLATPAEAHGRVIADGIPEARFVILEGAAHLAVAERPERMTELILSHLE